MIIIFISMVWTGKEKSRYLLLASNVPEKSNSVWKSPTQLHVQSPWSDIGELRLLRADKTLWSKTFPSNTKPTLQHISFTLPS